MYTCHNPATMDVYRFRSIDALVRRLGGTHYSVDRTGVEDALSTLVQAGAADPR